MIQLSDATREQMSEELKRREREATLANLDTWYEAVPPAGMIFGPSSPRFKTEDEALAYGIDELSSWSELRFTVVKVYGLKEQK